MTITTRYMIPVILMAGILFSCRNEIEEIQALTDVIDMPVQTSHNTEYDYTEGGKIRNRLKATQLDRFLGEDPRLEASGGFSLIIFDSLEIPEAFLTADKGIYFEQKNLLEAHDNVILTNVNGDSLMTEELIWVQDSAKVYTEREVIIATEDGKFYGKGLESDEKFTNYTIHNIHGNFNVDENELDAGESD